MDDISKEKELKSIHLTYCLWVIISAPVFWILADYVFTKKPPFDFICFLIFVAINIVFIIICKYKERKYLQNIDPVKWKQLSLPKLFLYAVFSPKYLPLMKIYTVLWLVFIFFLGFIKLVLDHYGYWFL